LDWLYEHDVTTLFAGLALQARRRFGIQAQHLHRDTTSFSVSGEYATKEEGDPVPIAITYGYSRDHREDLKQWMCALATTHDGDIPLFLRPLDGNSSDKEHLSAAVKEVMTQLRDQLPEEHEQRIAIFDSGGYSEANMKSYNDANIWWISRVPETSTSAKTALEEVEGQWQVLSDGSGEYVVRTMELPQGKERWVIVRTHAQLQATQERMEKQVKKTQQEWEKRLWHLSTHTFGCETDARTAWEKALKGKPSWLMATFTLKAQKQYQQRGRPKKEATPDQTVWSLVPTLAVDQPEVTALARKKAAFIVATNILDAQRLSPEQVISTYKEQGGVERGFRFLKDPLFLASSVFVKKPERVIALSFVMVLCLLVYRLAEHLLRRQLLATEQTVPNQVNKPTARPTMRWIFHCFEGIDLLHIRMGSHWHTQVLGLQALHQQVLRLLGPAYSQFYFLSP
jgi:transposase